MSLADYRLRYASYRADPGPMELHRRFPMIAMWDDREVANNSWKDGANNHGPQDGLWDGREAAGIRAFREWLLMVPADHERYQLGDLATLFRLETRLLARSRQLDLAAAPSGADNPAQAAAAFRDGPLADRARTMRGERQEKWLADGLAAATAAGTRWQLLAQQVVVAPSRLPDVTPDRYAPGTAASTRDQAELSAMAAFARLNVPTGLGRWDGYPAARAPARQRRARRCGLSC